MNTPLAPAAAEPATHLAIETGFISAQRVALPRDEGRILQKLKVLAAAAGEDFYYRFPVKEKGGGTKFIEGPSIECAQAVARVYGNCAIDCRAVDMGPNIQFLARFVDIETGFQLTRPFQQRKSQQTMRTDADRQGDILFQIGVSKATRNVIANALKQFCNFAFEEAKTNLIEKVGKNLPAYRARLVARYAELDIELKRVEATVGRVADKWLAPDIARLIAEIQAIGDGMADKAEMYPSLDKTAAAPPPKPGLDQFNPAPPADDAPADIPPEEGDGP